LEIVSETKFLAATILRTFLTSNSEFDMFRGMDVKNLSGAQLLQLREQIPAMPVNEAITIAHALGAAWKSEAKAFRVKKKLLLQVLGALQERGGIVVGHTQRGPKPGVFKIIPLDADDDDKTPLDGGAVQIRRGLRELAVFFDQAWASVISKATATLQAKHPGKPEQWYVDHDGYRAFRLPDVPLPAAPEVPPAASPPQEVLPSSADIIAALAAADRDAAQLRGAA
jgi:hypothetical protein